MGVKLKAIKSSLQRFAMPEYFSLEYSGQINHAVHILLHINQILCDVILQNIKKVCKEQTTILNFYP
jgi:hypothetical protein